MILVYIEHIDKIKTILRSGAGLAVSLKKELGILKFVEDEHLVNDTERELKSQVEKENIPDVRIIVLKGELNSLGEICEQYEASFLLMQLDDNRSKYIQRYLNACRSLRIPYLIFKNSFSALDIKKALVPITFLEEEYEKAQFASAFGRFYHAEIMLLLANDYGSKAATTAAKMEQLFDKFNLNYTRKKAIKDSFKVEKEAVQVAKDDNFDIIILSASREYGLDDMLFGPKEQHIIKTSGVPVLLVNPRGDLYALCD